jgi:DNA-binding CsgD family transcriptional regulator
MANFDFVPDVSACLNKIATEYVNCGVRGNCFFEGHLCNGITYNDNKLTLRELKMMALIRKGLLDKEIAELLFASPETIKTTKRKIQKKLGVERKAMIAVVATEWQLN